MQNVYNIVGLLLALAIYAILVAWLGKGWGTVALVALCVAIAATHRIVSGKWP